MYVGKTAPRLIEDLLNYDPRRERKAGRNILTDQPPKHEPSKLPTFPVPPNSCRHVFTTKFSQSILPQVGGSPETDGLYKVASICQNCRWHLALIADFRADLGPSEPCHKGSDYPLHHFVYCAEAPVETDGLVNGNTSIARQRIYKFDCTAPKCPARIQIELQPPRITQSLQELMTDRALLERRCRYAEAKSDPVRGTFEVARPAEVLDILAAYLRDSLDPMTRRDKIPAENRRFMTAFGNDCDELLEFLGFRKSVSLHGIVPSLV